MEINVPSVEIVDGLPLDDENLLALEAAVNEWALVLSEVMQAAMEKMPAGLGPLAEIEMWRDR